MQQGKLVETRKTQAEKPAIVVRNVTKEFIIPHERRTTIFENISGMFSPSTYEKFVALKDVSFTVNRGESVGIIGDNGSGKSTLLKIISKILRPTSGSIEINGKITPFLELGVGFQPDMTAKENIEVYSTIMGMSDKEIAANLDHVLEFAGLANFRDTKLKNFSSGMQVRLAFATAIQKKPDILLVDEVLAVGDMDFQRKCLEIFQKYKDDKVTTIFVSHDLNSVRKFCDKTLLLNNGKAVAFDYTNEVIDSYIYKVNIDQSQSENNQIIELEQPVAEAGTEGLSPGTNRDSLEFISKYRKLPNFRWGNKDLELTSVKLLDKNGREGNSFISGDAMTISMEYALNKEVKNPIFGFDIANEHGDNCFGTNTLLKGIHIDDLKNKGTIQIRIEEIPLLQGKYYLSVAAQSNNSKITYDWHNKTHTFYMVNNSGEEGFIRFNCNFVID
jgi:lipopolysaccharide transport system ATP-binding protein